MALIDQYSPLDHKAGMGDNDGGDFGDLPEFYDDDQIRRLKAYRILRATVETTARLFLVPPEGEDEEEFQAQWREFGEPALYAERVAAAVVGEDSTLGIVGADDPVPNSPVLDDPPTPPADHPDPAVQAALDTAYQQAVEVWTANAQQLIDAWREITEKVPALQARQRWLQEWADAEQWLTKVLESELEHTVPIGDCVHVYGWDPVKQRPSVEIYDPETYMPVLDADRASVFPNRVHLVWTYTDDDDEDQVHRLTWELVPLDPLDPDYEPVEQGPAIAYLTEGQVQTHVCLFTDVTVPAEAFDKVDDPIGAGQFNLVTVPGQTEPVEANRVPIGLDFIPVVHYPNTSNTADKHFGRSFLIRAAQLLDEIAGTDTDESLASQWAARPPLAATGLPAGIDQLDVNPGKVLGLEQGGRLYTVDMAENLPAVSARLEELLRRLSVLLQVPEGLVGRVDASDVPSGIAFVLSFTAFEQLVLRYRMARQPKHALGFKMVQRIAIQHGDPTLDGDTNVYPAEFRPGPYMPQDLLSLAQLLKILVEADLVSQETGLAMLQGLGIPSGDLGAELESIRGTQTDQALQIADATGSAIAAARFLGLNLADLVADQEAGEDTAGSVPNPLADGVDLGASTGQPAGAV